LYVGNMATTGQYNNYVIGGNVCNAFIVGELGSQDDFYLVGAEPPQESNYPLLNGNVLDSEGHLLFRLVRNLLVLNPGHCSKIVGDRVGYEIHDSAGVPIFKVRTTFGTLAGVSGETFITTLEGKFYNKHQQLVLTASAGEAGERIEATAKLALGFSRGFDIVQSMNTQELQYARVLLASRCAVWEPIRGEHINEELNLDEKVLIDCHLKSCTIHVHTGEFALLGNSSIEHCRLQFHDAAERIQKLIMSA